MAGHGLGHGTVRGRADTRGPDGTICRSTTSSRSWPISPTTTMIARTTAPSFGVSAKLTESITSSFNWFYSREQETSLSYTDKVWFNGQEHPRPWRTAAEGIDPTDALLDRRQWRRAERGVQCQRRRKPADAVSEGHRRRPQLPVGHQVQRWRPGRAATSISRTRMRPSNLQGRPGRRRARPLHHQRRRGDFARSAGLQ